MSRGALAANIVKCITSFLSLISSSTIIHMIRMSPRGLKSPYSRIIFGLSIGDILLTLGLLIGPFFVPRGTLKSPMALGNTATCDYAGFILVLGVFTTTFYLLFLIYFFLRRVKYRVSPQKFAYGEERYLHILICLMSLALSSTALARKEYNPLKNGSFCVVQSYPPKCEEDEENFVECTRGQSAQQTAKVFALILASILLCLFVLLALITCHVFSIERNLTYVPNHTQSNPSPANNRQDNDNDPNAEDFHEEENQEVNNGSVNDNQPKESLTRKSLDQSMLYIFAYIITFVAPFTALAIPQSTTATKSTSSIILWSISTLLPTYGIFLILIYTRPKVQLLSQMYPEVTWRLCFSVVISSGADVPPAHELKIPQNIQAQMSEMTPQQQQQSEFSYSSEQSESTNGDYYEGLRRSMIAASFNDGWYAQ